MAPKKWTNGKWVTEAKKGWGRNKPGQYTTPAGKVVVDWACGVCDVTADPAYMGNYANQNVCPWCNTEKRLACHMTMETRRARLKAGTLKPKEQAKADREERKKESGEQTTKDKKPPGGSKAEIEAKWLSDLCDDLDAGKITQMEFKERRTKGLPGESNNSGGDQNAGGSGAGAEGATSASTRPQDTNSKWTEVGAKPFELKKKLDLKRKLLKDAEKMEEVPEIIEKLKASVQEAEEKHQAALPVTTKLTQHDKKILDLKWFIEQGQKQLDKAQEQKDWWEQQIQAKKDKQAVLKSDLDKAEEAKKAFMASEGIKEPEEGEPTAPTPSFELFTQQARDFVFEQDDSDEAKEAQKAIVLVQNFVTKQAEARRAYLLPGWNDGAGNPEEVSDDEGFEEEGEEDEEADEAELMEDIKQLTAKMPTQKGKDGNQPLMLSVEENAKLRKEAKDIQKERKEKEGKAVRSSKPIAKKHLKQSGKKHGPTLTTKKDQDVVEEGK